MFFVSTDISKADSVSIIRILITCDVAKFKQTDAAVSEGEFCYNTLITQQRILQPVGICMSITACSAVLAIFMFVCLSQHVVLY